MHFQPSGKTKRQGLTCLHGGTGTIMIFHDSAEWTGMRCRAQDRGGHPDRDSSRPVDGEEIELKLTADQYNYHLGFVRDDEFIELDHASCQSVATKQLPYGRHVFRDVRHGKRQDRAKTRLISTGSNTRGSDPEEEIHEARNAFHHGCCSLHPGAGFIACSG